MIVQRLMDKRNIRLWLRLLEAKWRAKTHTVALYSRITNRERIPEKGK